ncbi:MAG: hypothetical protein H6815_02285 [Phycisphaeraceae bacterium]|nr:hypothetical protein [Phycisphaerales bacterium]MCB9859256.1 hypothetical protein [Phycisphaeraceae bacterium]
MEHFEYWRGTVALLYARVVELQSDLREPLSSNTVGQYLKIRLEKLATRFSNELKKPYYDNASPYIYSMSAGDRSRLIGLSEQLHHIDYVARELPHFTSRGLVRRRLPPAADGIERVIALLYAVIADVMKCIHCTALGFEKREPIVRWRWTTEYMHDSFWNISRFPATDLVRAYMWPLIGHEIGHSIYKTIMDRHVQHINVDVYNNLENVKAKIFGLYHKCATRLQIDPELLTTADVSKMQLEEFFADAIGAHLFGFAYFDAIFRYMGATGDLSVSASDYDINMRFHDQEARQAVLDNVNRRMNAEFSNSLGQAHPMTIVRLACIAKMCDINKHEVAITGSVFKSLESELPQLPGWTNWHKGLWRVLDRQLSSLANSLSEYIVNLFPQIGLTEQHYLHVSEISQSYSTTAMANVQSPDSRVIVIADALVRRQKRSMGTAAGCFVTPICAVAQ